MLHSIYRENVVNCVLKRRLTAVGPFSRNKSQIVFTGIQPGPKSIHIYSHCYKKVTCSKFKIKTLNQSVEYVFHTNNIVFNRRPGSIYLIFINFEHISHLVLVFLLLTLNMQLPAGRHSGVFIVLFQRCFQGPVNTLATIKTHHIETSQLISNANQLSGFYMMGNIGL